MSPCTSLARPRPVVLFRLQRPIAITSTPPHASTGGWRYRISGILVSGRHFDHGKTRYSPRRFGRRSNARPDSRDGDRASNVVTLTVKSRAFAGSIHPHAGYDAATEHGDERHCGRIRRDWRQRILLKQRGYGERFHAFDKYLRGGICTHRARAKRHDKLAID